MISVSKKLAKDQSELNDLVSSLGGDYRWSYDNSCTHFIFQVKSVESQKDRGQLFEIDEIVVLKSVVKDFNPICHKYTVIFVEKCEKLSQCKSFSNFSNKHIGAFGYVVGI